jgi:hypothetical protein
VVVLFFAKWLAARFCYALSACFIHVNWPARRDFMDRSALENDAEN